MSLAQNRPLQGIDLSRQGVFPHPAREHDGQQPLLLTGRERRNPGGPAVGEEMPQAQLPDEP